MKNVHLFLALSLSACAPVHRQDTQVKSLDNFARKDGADVNKNHCGMDLESLAAAPASVKGRLGQIVAQSDDLKRDVLSALTAVPATLAAPFFRAGGVVEVTPNAADLCAEVPLTASEREFASENQTTIKTCWRQHAVGEHPVIYVAADSAEIRHSLVRIFAYLYGELFVDRLEAMIAQKQKLEPAVAAAVASYDRDSIVIAKALLADAASRNASASARLAKFQKQDARQFSRVAVAEALDSFYCSPASQLAFRQSFGQTFKAFKGTAKTGLAAAFGPTWFQ